MTFLAVIDRVLEAACGAPGQRVQLDKLTPQAALAVLLFAARFGLVLVPRARVN